MSKLTPLRKAMLCAAAVLVVAANAGAGIAAGASAPRATGTTRPIPAAARGSLSPRHRLRQDQTTCDYPEPAWSFISLTQATDAQEICGITAMEDLAEQLYAEIEGFSSVDDPRMEVGEPEMAGYVLEFLNVIAGVEASDPNSLSYDDQGAYDWLEGLDQNFEQLEAQDSLNEYNDWDSEQCNYKPPNTSLFSYDPTQQAYCFPSGGAFAGVFSGLTPPSYSEFLSYGAYDAYQTIDDTNPLNASPNQDLIDDGITAGAGVAATILAGNAPAILLQMEDEGASELASRMALFYKDFLPYQKTSIKLQNDIDKYNEEVEQEAKATQDEATLDKNGDPPDPNAEVLDGDGEGIGEVTNDTGIDITDAAAGGADALGSIFSVAAIALTIAAIEAVNVINDAEIQGQLKSNLATATGVDAQTEVNNLLNDPTGTGGVINSLNFQNQLTFDGPVYGLDRSHRCHACAGVLNSIPQPTSGSGATALQVTALTPSGQPTAWQWTAPTVSGIDTWPLGIDDGYDGIPQVTVGVEDGQAYTEQDPGTAATDATADGESGFLPSGELNYFNAAGQPEIAYIDGDQFDTVTSPGSIDAAGEDQGDSCATAGECTLSSSLVVMALGGTAQLVDELQANLEILGMTCTENVPGFPCLSDDLVPNGELAPLGGSTVDTQEGSLTEYGTGQLYRLTIVPDTGTGPGTEILNSSGAAANDLLDGAPDGGLVAGQTVTLTDPETNPLGYSTTYTWQIETKCPYDPANAPESIQGVPVCSNSPDYGSTTGLAQDEQDLATCTESPCDPDAPAEWTEDPAFRGDPVTTLTGQSVSYTFPAAGTYHVRLITTDQYGVTQQSDQDLVVSQPGPPGESVTFAAASGPAPSYVAPAVIGPVTDGDALTLTGCLTSPDDQGATAYSVPQVTVDWGDGSTPDTGQPGSDTDPNLTFAYQPGGGCSSPWEYTVTHTYDVDTGDLPYLQQHVSITIADVTNPPTPADLLPPSASPQNTFNVWADVSSPDAAASFDAGASASATFTAGSVGSYTGDTFGLPVATVDSAPAGGVTENGVACAAGLPGGVTFQPNADGSFTISGASNVNAGGCYALTLTATDGVGSPATESFVLNENEAPAVTSASSAAMESGSPGSFTVTTSGFPDPSLRIGSVSCAPDCADALPSDLTFADNGNGSATLSSDGNDLAAADTGTYTISVVASNGAGSVTQTLTLTIGGPPAFTTSSTAGFYSEGFGTFTVATQGYPTASLSCSLVYDATVTDCTTGLGYTLIDTNLDAGGVNDGLYFVDQGNGTATLSGVPYQSGSFTVTITATNAVGSVSQTLTIFVSNTGGPTLTFVDSGAVTQDSPPSGETPALATAAFTVGQPGTLTVCSNNPTDVLSAPGLPNGLTLTNGAGSGCAGGDHSATVSGTPTTPLAAGSLGGSPIRVVDNGGGVGWLTIYLNGPPTFTSPATATFTQGQSGTFTVSQGTVYTDEATGCFSLGGNLPSGLSFVDNGDNTATISGTPTDSGQSQVTVDATDCNGTTTAQDLTIDVDSPPQFTSADSGGSPVGQGATFTVTTDGDAYPTPSISASGLPTGVTFTDNGDGTGTLTVGPDAPATPTAAAMTFTATSPAGSATQDFSLAIGSPAVFTSPAASPTTATFTVGSPVGDLFQATGAPTPAFTCTVSGDPCSGANLPPGLSFTDNGNGTATLSGTPTAAGSAQLTVAATNLFQAADTVVNVNVDTAPAFAGTITSGTCASPSATATDTMTADSVGSWTLCGSGSPSPEFALTGVSCSGTAVSLPAGLTFTDNGNGSATISGSPDNGDGAACPSGYTLDVSMANGAGTVTQSLTLFITDVITATSAPDSPTFVAGAPNAYSLTASGVPSPSFTVDPSTPLPPWLTLNDHGDGTATLSGEPPAGDAGTTVQLEVDEANGQAAPVTEPLTVTISPLALTAAAPPEADLGEPFSYTFTASPAAAFSVASGSFLPAGLTLSSSGVLSGTPTETGVFPVHLTLTGGGATVTTSTIDVTVGVGPHALEISQFRSFGPNGQGDWFVQLYNTTSATIPLRGWSLGVQALGSSTPWLIPIGTGSLAPGRTTVVAGPAFSLSADFPSTGPVGPGTVALPGGFEVVAPEGSVVDVAGEAGAASGLIAGTGAAFPKKIDATRQDAFVRRGWGKGQPVDTDDNAADFVYQPVLLPQAVTFTSTPPDPGRFGGTYTVTATGGGSGQAVVFSLGPSTTAGTCTLSGATVDFTGTGLCVIQAHQAGSGVFLRAPSVVQRVYVHKATQAITFTSTPPHPAVVGGSYTLSATGGGSGNPVTFGIAPPSLGPNDSTDGACALSGNTVEFTGEGYCEVLAHQGGDTDYTPAPEVRQQFYIHFS